MNTEEEELSQSTFWILFFNGKLSFQGFRGWRSSPRGESRIDLLIFYQQDGPSWEHYNLHNPEHSEAVVAKLCAMVHQDVPGGMFLPALLNVTILDFVRSAHKILHNSRLWCPEELGDGATMTGICDQGKFGNHFSVGYLGN